MKFGKGKTEQEPRPIQVTLATAMAILAATTPLENRTFRRRSLVPKPLVRLDQAS